MSFAQTGNQKPADTKAIAAYESNRYLGLYEASEAKSNFTITSDFQLIAENDTLALYLKPESLALRIINKKTGYIWSSNLDSYEEERLNATWEAYFESGITIEYYETNAKTQDYKVIQESVLTSDQTTVSFQKVADGFEAKILFGESQIELTFSVHLTESGFDVELKPEDIKEKEVEQTNEKKKESPKRLVSVTFYPFLGSTKAAGQSGYFFLPDGDGALVNFEKFYENINTGYQKKYYGEDFGLIPSFHNQDFIKAPKPLNYPIYGIVHGVSDNGLSVLIKKGSSNAELTMNPAGVRTDFYYITNRFIYRQPYLHVVNSSTSALVMQENMTPVEVQMSIELLSDEMADYMGIATNYRNYLNENGMLAKNAASEEVPLMLDVLMSSVKPGIFFNKLIPMTSVEQLYRIVDDLKLLGVDKTVATAIGMFKDTATVNAKDRFRLQHKIGDLDDLADLAGDMEEQGDLLALQMNYTEHSYKEYADIKPESDLLYMMNKNYLYYEYKIGLKTVKSTMLNSHGFDKYMAADVKKMEELGINGISYRLPQGASSYGKVPVTREASFAQIGKTLGDTKQKANYNYVSWDQGTPSVLANVTGLKNILMETTLFPYITDSIPFTSLVYHGSIDLFSQTLNTIGDPEIRKLKMVEWGIYPAFDVTYEDPSELLYSENWYLVSSKYSDWKDEILETYTFVSEALKNVTGETIVDHQVLASGVVLVTYSNQVAIVVNYTDQGYQSANLNVAAGSYEVIRP
jgi:hypothetical protein